MTFASDKLYKDIIQKMLSRLASTIKVREIIPHLHCLTLTDREEIEAKREVAGNYNAMQVLMDCLRRRENWPEQFIRALKEIEQQSLANEISDAYDRIRGINPQRSAPPAAAAAAAAAAATSGPAPAAAAAAAATAVVSPPAPAHVPTPAAATPPPAPSPAPALVTTATIHNVPRSTPPLLTPSPEEPPAPPAASAPAQSPPESLPRVDAPGPAEASVSVSAPEAPAPSPPKPAQPVEPSPPISAPPALLPSVASPPQMTTSLQQNQVSFRPEETTSLDASSDLTAISEPSSAAATSLPTSIMATSPFQLDTSSQPSSSPEESKTPLGVAESSASVKHPIQDTSPPQKVAVLTQDVSSTVSQRMETTRSPVPPNSQAPASSRGMAQVSRSASPPAVESVEYFSKPGILMGAEPSLASSDDLQISRPPTESAESSPVQPARPAPVSSHLQPRQQLQEPCSVTSDQLMLSNSTTSTAGSSLSQPPTVSPGNLVPHSTPEENSFSEQAVSSSENQPVEDTYESFCQSLQGEPDTMVHVGQISEEPSILNGQPPSMMGNAAHANEIRSTMNHNRPTESPPQSVGSENQPSLKKQSITQTTQRNEVHTNEQAGACPKPSTPACQISELNASGQPEQSEEAQRAVILSDPRFIAATAAVGVAAAAFMAWKLKH